MKKSLVDVPVLLLFFVRPDKTAQVFEQIRKARPSKLYLFQDGPRDGRADDIENVKKCREVVENIDWECEVHRNYSEKNYGCDPAEFLSQKWMFETEEYGIILEDDDVPSVSFFRYCKELLERYKDNEKIQMICGYNPIDYYDNGSGADYFFSKVSSIWGWATWKRVVDTWDSEYKWIENPKQRDKVISGLPSAKEKKQFFAACERHKASGVEYYETINASNMYIYDRIALNPTYNMISNIGVGDNTTHSVSDLNLMPRATRRLLYKDVHEYEFPLKHPDEIVCDYNYKAEVDKALGNIGIGKIINKIESRYLFLRYRGIKGIIAKFKKKLKR